MSKSEKKYPKGYWMGIGISIGIAISVAMGPIFDNFGVGIGIGIAIGSVKELRSVALNDSVYKHALEVVSPVKLQELRTDVQQPPAHGGEAS